MTDAVVGARVFVFSGMFYLGDPEESLPTEAIPAGAFLETGPDGVFVITGLQYGYVTVHAARHDHEPPLPQGPWDAVQDTTLDLRIETLTVCSMEEGPARELPPLTDAPGAYRLRVCARGQDQGRALDSTGADENSGESYHLQLWPVR
jgi:hypothetical protein